MWICLNFPDAEKRLADRFSKVREDDTPKGEVRPATERRKKKG